MAGPDDEKKLNPLPNLHSNNYLERLGLRPSPSRGDIKKAFSDLAKIVHPDKNPGDPTAMDKFKLLNEAYQNVNIGITSKMVSGHGHHPRQRERKPQTPEDAATRRRAEELKTEAAEVENFEQGGILAGKIDTELKQSGRRDELLMYLTRRLQFLLQQKIKEHTDLESLAVLAKEVNIFVDTPQGRLLFSSFFTDELDVTALNIGLELLSKANTKQEVDQVLVAIAKYPATFGAIIEVPVSESKEDAMAKIRFLSKITKIRPRTGERLDQLVAEVNAYQFADEKRGADYKKRIIDFIERHRKIYYQNGVFTPLKISPEVGDE